MNRRQNSINAIYKVQLEYYKEKMTDYYEVVNQGKTSIPSFILADKIVGEYEDQGRFNEYGDLKEVI